MKKYKFIIGLFTLVFVFLFLFKGCILDDFDNLIQNVPISKQLKIEGDQTTITVQGDLCLMNSSVIQDYKDKIQKIKFVTATFTIDSVTAGLKGNLTISISSNGNQLLVKTISDITVQSTYIFPFTQQQKDAINKILDNSKEGTCYQCQATITKTEPSGKVIIYGTFSIALEMTTDI